MKITVKIIFRKLLEFFLFFQYLLHFFVSPALKNVIHPVK